MNAPDRRLAIGDVAPGFSLLDDAGATVTLSSLVSGAGMRGLVVFFYPAAMTPACTMEACEFRDALAPLRDAGYSLVGISPDDPETLARFRTQDGLTYPLLSDPDHAVAEAWGAWGTKINYGREYQGLIRSTFVLDAEGTVTQALYNVRATGHVGRVRKLLGLEVPPAVSASAARAGSPTA